MKCVTIALTTVIGFFGAVVAQGETPGATAPTRALYSDVDQFVEAFYAAREGSTVWTNQDVADAALLAIANADLDGLEPEDFGFSRLKALRESGDAIGFDRALTRGLADFARVLKRGKTTPGGPEGEVTIVRAFSGDPIELLNQAISSGNVSELIEKQRPRLPYYGRLKEALADYREIAADGGFTVVPDGGTLRIGDVAPRVAKLVQRLAEEGWHFGAISVSESGTAFFDEEVDQAVKSFQARHGLEADGVAGPATLAALNTSAQARVDQVRVNMERARWVGDLPVERTVMVNIAGFEAMLVENGEIAWQTRVIVGKDYTATPVFSDEISYVEFNPTWTVPRSIIRNELAPKVIADPGFLDRNGYYLAYKDGTHLDARKVDWTSVTPSNFPYWIVQKPGERNALGLVKFMFPNKHSVYMHDTPQRQLFDRTVRTFSHGCIRTENPMKYAELLLGQQGWDRARIDEAVASGKTIRVNLERKVPITIMYWTVDTVGSELRFYPDIYGRDAKVLAALDTQIAAPGVN